MKFNSRLVGVAVSLFISLSAQAQVADFCRVVPDSAEFNVLRGEMSEFVRPVSYREASARLKRLMDDGKCGNIPKAALKCDIQPLQITGQFRVIRGNTEFSKSGKFEEIYAAALDFSKKGLCTFEAKRRCQVKLDGGRAKFRFGELMVESFSEFKDANKLYEKYGIKGICEPNSTSSCVLNFSSDKYTVYKGDIPVAGPFAAVSEMEEQLKSARGQCSDKVRKQCVMDFSDASKGWMFAFGKSESYSNALEMKAQLTKLGFCEEATDYSRGYCFVSPSADKSFDSQRKETSEWKAYFTIQRGLELHGNQKKLARAFSPALSAVELLEHLEEMKASGDCLAVEMEAQKCSMGAFSTGNIEYLEERHKRTLPSTPLFYLEIGDKMHGTALVDDIPTAPSEFKSFDQVAELLKRLEEVGLCRIVFPYEYSFLQPTCKVEYQGSYFVSISGGGHAPMKILDGRISSSYNDSAQAQAEYNKIVSSGLICKPANK